jgi:hypothetical protein
MGQITKRHDLPARIRETARRMGCLPDLESIRFEKGWSKAKQGHGVYCGIGFADTRQGDCTDPPSPPFDAEALVNVLRISLIDRTDVSRSILPQEQAEAFTQESLMMGEAVVHIPVRPPPDPEELESATALAINADSIEEATERQDRLLTWLSCMGGGTWAQFVEAARSLGFEQVAKPGDVLIRLMLLGHLEISADGRSWRVNPPILCEAEDGSWFLCGQRDDALADLLSKHPAVTISPQPYGLGPSRISVVADARCDYVEVLQNAGVKCYSAARAARRLADSLPSGSEWSHSVRGNVRPQLDEMLVQRVVLGSERLESVRPCSEDGKALRVPSGLYVLIADQGRGRSIRAFCHEDGSWTRCDWYGMAYLERRRLGELRSYGTVSGHLLPSDGPWPRIFERALVLVSGFLPVHIPGRGRLFSASETSVPQSLATKLGVRVDSWEEAAG